MWTPTNAKIFAEFIVELNRLGVRYFVLRNYKGLPEYNESKDIDIIIEPGTFNKVESLLLKLFKNNGMEYQYQCQFQFQFLHCIHGINLTKKNGIHIDLIEGYSFKGYEIFTFDELYEHVMQYKNFYVLDDLFNGVMIFIYKQFGYAKPKLKQSYKDEIYSTCVNYPEFYDILVELTNKKYADHAVKKIKERDFDALVDCSNQLTKFLRKYAFQKNRWKTVCNTAMFLWLKFRDIILLYNKRAMTFAVMAPDGTGKTTFLDELLKDIDTLFVNDPQDGRCHVYHFRPELLPNLGAMGEKATMGGYKQDKNFTDPHRAKVANPISSLIRITYYWLDYIIGWMVYIRKDVHFEKFSVFDRYSYDLYVDPRRTKLNLPDWLRKLYVKMMRHPKIVFCLKAKPETIYARKQELSLEEIRRQLSVYEEVTSFSGNFVVIDAEQKPDVMANCAMENILEKFCKRL